MPNGKADRAESGVASLPWRVVPGSIVCPVRVEYLDSDGHVMHVRPGSGLELELYERLISYRNGAERNGET